MAALTNKRMQCFKEDASQEADGERLSRDVLGDCSAELLLSGPAPRSSRTTEHGGRLPGAAIGAAEGMACLFKVPPLLDTICAIRRRALHTLLYLEGCEDGVRSRAWLRG